MSPPVSCTPWSGEGEASRKPGTPGKGARCRSVQNRAEWCLVCELCEGEPRLRLYPGLDAVSAQHATHPQVAAHAAQEPDDVHPLVPAPHRDRGGYIPLDW